MTQIDHRLRVKCESIKLEDNIGEKLDYLGCSNDI